VANMHVHGINPHSVSILWLPSVFTG